MELQRLHSTIDYIAGNFFVDPHTEPVGDRDVRHWKTTMGVFSYIGNKNTLLIGKPGSGKTTFSSIISAVITGLPFDVFDTLKIQGHPEQTKDTMIGRLDLGRLAEEGVVWHAAMCLPSLTFDEFTGLPPAKQNIVIEYIRTGRAEQLGKNLRRGKIPFFATVNHKRAGTYELSPPILDRFHISLECLANSAFHQDGIQQASANIDTQLSDPARTDRILAVLYDKERTVEEKTAYLDEEIRRSERLLPRTQIRALAQQAAQLPYDAHATTYLRCIWEECNTTKLYGENRSADLKDISAHNKAFASSRITEGVSPRAWGSIKFYASMLALHMGDDQVMLEHVQAVAPYCLAHRLEFESDHKAAFKEKPRLRGEHENLDLARRLLDDVKGNYDQVAGKLQLLDAFLAGKITEEDRLAEVKELLDRTEPDHPLYRKYYELAREIGHGR